MEASTIDWGFALLITGMGMGVVFLLLVVLIGLIGLQTKVLDFFDGSKKTIAEAPTVGTTDTHPTPHEQAAIAMAMSLYFDVHDEEPHIITIEEVERRYSPWSSKIYSMRNNPNK